MEKKKIAKHFECCDCKKRYCYINAAIKHRVKNPGHIKFRRINQEIW